MAVDVVARYQVTTAPSAQGKGSKPPIKGLTDGTSGPSPLNAPAYQIARAGKACIGCQRGALERWIYIMCSGLEAGRSP